jgi:DNA-binding NtrC family response regulator
MSTVRLSKLDPVKKGQSGFLIGPRGSIYEFTEIGELLRLGRDQQNQLALNDRYVSAFHARIEKRHIGYVIKDLQSRNGTAINGVRVTEAPLHEQDVIRVGETDLVFTTNPIPDVAPKTLTSKNAAYQYQLERLPQVATMDIAVLILGPSGCGQELIAKAVHEHSNRRRGPFVSVNCSALSESLVETELFGHLRGSFTGAMNDRKGAFEMARGGTLFLDEIGDLPISLQPKLLRALENQEIRPVGSDRSVTTDVRIVAATHQSLADKIALQQFRLDLFYRLQGFQVMPPALRERPEDFEDLLFAFAKQMKVRFSFHAIEAMKRHSWPGNVRELKNAVARAKALHGMNTVQVQDVVMLIPQGMEGSPLLPVSPGQGGFTLKKLERDVIIARLNANNGNQRKTAVELGVPKSTLHDRLRSYGVTGAKKDNAGAGE